MLTFKSDSDGLISIFTNTHRDGLPFKAHPFSICSDQHSFQFLRPHNPNDVLDSLPEEVYEKDRFLPYWAEQWPSSEVMISFLQSQTLAVHDKIIELGCGLGLISTVAGLQCQAVVATDISFDALLFTKTNIQLNQGRPMPCCMDWRMPPFKAQFDLLIASDVLYEARWIEPILSCCKKLLTPGGKAWIADPCRCFWEAFKNRAREHTFNCKVIQRVKNQEKHLIEIIELKLP